MLTAGRDEAPLAYIAWGFACALKDSLSSKTLAHLVLQPQSAVHIPVRLQVDGLGQGVDMAELAPDNTNSLSLLVGKQPKHRLQLPLLL